MFAAWLLAASILSQAAALLSLQTHEAWPCRPSATVGSTVRLVFRVLRSGSSGACSTPPLRKERAVCTES